MSLSSGHAGPPSARVTGGRRSLAGENKTPYIRTTYDSDPRPRMSALAFDTHAYVKRLVGAGMPEPQAEVIAEEQRSLIANDLATKRDIAEIKRGVKEMETRLTRDMKEMEIRLRHDLTIRMGGMMVTAVIVAAALVKLL